MVCCFSDSFQVKIWFQNRRTKWKKQENISNAEAAEHKVGGQRHGDQGKQQAASSPSKTTSPATKDADKTPDHADTSSLEGNQAEPNMVADPSGPDTVSVCAESSSSGRGSSAGSNMAVSDGETSENSSGERDDIPQTEAEKSEVHVAMHSPHGNQMNRLSTSATLSHSPVSLATHSQVSSPPPAHALSTSASSHLLGMSPDQPNQSRYLSQPQLHHLPQHHYQHPRLEQHHPTAKLTCVDVSKTDAYVTDHGDAYVTDRSDSHSPPAHAIAPISLTTKPSASTSPSLPEQTQTSQYHNGQMASSPSTPTRDVL